MEGTVVEEDCVSRMGGHVKKVISKKGARISWGKNKRKIKATG